jgi:hypothetical protein
LWERGARTLPESSFSLVGEGFRVRGNAASRKSKLVLID